MSVHLSAVAGRVNRIDQVDESERRALVVELMPALEELVADPEVNRDTKINLVTQAHRAVDPRSLRVTNPEYALEDLREALKGVAPKPGSESAKRPTPVDRDEAKSLIGEGIHAGLRKVAESQAATDAYRAIHQMPAYEWDAVLSFLVDGLDSMGIELVRKEGN